MRAKRLTVENFLLPDPRTREFTGLDSENRRHALSAVDWAHEILSYELERRVPAEVAREYEGARGVLLYGYFWHPLCGRGARLCLRAADRALSDACVRRGAPKRASTPASRVAWLAKRGVVSRAGEARWGWLMGEGEALGPETSPSPSPARSLEILETVAYVIGELYAADAGAEAER